MPPPRSPPTSLTTLLNTLTSLLRTFSHQLSLPPNTKSTIPNPPNALSLLHDIISLLRAQTTKLSLLLLNKPFTPSAIASILTFISGQCLPGLMTVYEILIPEKYGDLLFAEVRSASQQLAARIVALERCIPCTDDAVRLLDEKREDILQATGKVWGICDRMVQVSEMGITGLAMEKMKEREELVKDAVEEVEEWDLDEEEGEDWDVGMSSDEEGKEEEGEKRMKMSTATDGIASPGNEQLPSLDSLEIKNIHATKARVLKTLKLMRMLYPALRKRRISTFPPFNRTSSLESLPPELQLKSFYQLVRYGEDFSTATDELVGALYDKDVGTVQKRMESMATVAERCVEGAKKGWSGNEDEFTEWGAKWMTRVEEVVKSP